VLATSQASRRASTDLARALDETDRTLASPTRADGLAGACVERGKEIERADAGVLAFDAKGDPAGRGGARRNRAPGRASAVRGRDAKVAWALGALAKSQAVFERNRRCASRGEATETTADGAEESAPRVSTTGSTRTACADTRRYRSRKCTVAPTSRISPPANRDGSTDCRGEGIHRSRADLALAGPTLSPG
jgi:hypothetical protein